nr:hypothetical protein BaRGS_001803 [Batillaria attramentaria]
MYDFSNKTDVETAVNELAAAANNGELYIIADEAYHYDWYNPSGHDLQYRDTVILCREPRDNLPMVSRLRARGLPVQVVTSRDDEAAIRDLAVTMNDTIMVTDRKL